ncbi:cyclohexanone monooxygenase, variant 2 [Fonsecaea monophora]|uniref:Cyclohexanone monooxygenase, variant 2 n=1 Tax=Fonsecaea monophora TaxID=254056 RepID=A0A177EP72_9EURO|nr:cyclohexanone monooxygenase, variant 2 [Fonsecaea monophora]OAG33785.1 cyclohexanone monooxygenase, variant 2 [Fonsecaea monophora]
MLDPPLDPYDPDSPALTERDWQYIQDFHNALKPDKIEGDGTLVFLRQHHPGYRDIEIRTINLNTSPEDVPVDHRLLVQELEAETEQDLDNQDVPDVADEDEGVDTSIVPDLAATEAEIQRLQDIKLRPFAKPLVLNYYPRYKQEANPEDYAMLKVLLHVPLCDINELRRLDIDDGFETFTKGWDYWNSTRVRTLRLDFMGELPPEPEDDGLEDLNVDDNANVEGSWEELAKQLPHRDNGSKINNPANLVVHSCADPDALEAKQRQPYDHFVTHYQLELAGLQNKQLLINPDEETARCHGKASPIARVALAGVAAHAISGRTPHAQFKLPVQFVKGFDALSIQNLTALQNGELSHRLKEIFEDKSNTKFGGMNIVIAGDFWQLPAARTQFRITTACAITVHKAQDITNRLSIRMARDELRETVGENHIFGTFTPPR